MECIGLFLVIMVTHMDVGVNVCRRVIVTCTHYAATSKALISSAGACGDKQAVC